ncbi:uncharacterized protein LOC126834478 [Adelges cooleyi]|uniref:uncharacterized protein LOC126834478 n=1 Tax=Adelges cooleyi TaxID=133065 RepID=UPI00217FC6EF|nr:uncharacterized protein LOC126834478 [Adelges cooleyi]
MYTKYIILFCLTSYYIPKVIAFDESEIYILFDEIRNEGENYVTARSLRKTYHSSERSELVDLLRNYGMEITENGKREQRIYFVKFKEALMDGYINRFSKKHVETLFNEIIIKSGTLRNYIIRNDLINHYEGRIPISQIDNVLSTFGDPNFRVIRLDFPGFRRAVNTGGIPAW